MLRKVTLSLVTLLVCAGAYGQAPPKEDYQFWHSCQQMMDECSDPAISAEDIWAAASIDEHPGAPYPLGDGPFLGLCYTHDKRSCPDCWCDDYVKISHFPDPKGWDHNGSNNATGCILGGMSSPAASHAAAAAKLKELCASGACCCPQVEAKPCDKPGQVKARDPITGSCCTFPNECSAPADWEKPIQPGDFRCDPNH